MRPSALNRSHRLQLAALGGLAGLLIAACGGGGGAESPTPPSGGSDRATALAEGPITGFGSIIVNGVRFDDSAATVDNDDGQRIGRSELKLGMTVEVDAGNLDRAQASGRAMRIRTAVQILGPVEAVDAAAGTLTVLGQPVGTSADTVFGESLGSLASVRVGDVIAVFGHMRGTDGYAATRIHAAAGATQYRLRGMLDTLDTATMRFTINGATISYAPLALPSAPGGGAPSGDDFRRCMVVRMDPAAVAGVWNATGMRPCPRQWDDGAEVHLRGMVTRMESAQAFEVNGVRVDASAAAFPDGTDGLRVGAAVEVEGVANAGVLKASKVELEERHVGEGRHRFELRGAVESLDAANRRFVLRGVTVQWADATEFRNGSAATLANGLVVEVKGMLSADRSQLAALRIELK